jgi:RNA polymerase sigma-70 factor, ECF subfamily
MQRATREYFGSDQAAVDERQLVLEVLAKDRKSTAEFVSRCTDYIYPYVCHHLLPRRDRVEDLMQEILMAAWQSLADFRGDSNLRSWVLGIARHKIEDYYRRQFRTLEVQEEDAEPVANAALELDELLDGASRQQKVQRTLTALPEAYGLALLWRYRENRSLREMAQLTGKSEKAMERLLARAREKFKRRWIDEQS